MERFSEEHDLYLIIGEWNLIWNRLKWLAGPRTYKFEWTFVVIVFRISVSIAVKRAIYEFVWFVIVSQQQTHNWNWLGGIVKEECQREKKERDTITVRVSLLYQKCNFFVNSIRSDSQHWSRINWISDDFHMSFYECIQQKEAHN